MAYEKKTWETGEVITADALNHLEQGIADCEQRESNKFVISGTPNFQNSTLTIDKTFAEVDAAYKANKTLILESAGNGGPDGYPVYMAYLDKKLVDRNDPTNITAYIFHRFGVEDAPTITIYEFDIRSDGNHTTWRIDTQ